MILYMTLLEETHTDFDAFVFSTPELAIKCAQRLAAENARDPADIEEEAVEGWLYCAHYGHGSSVYVVAKALDAPMELE